MGGKITKKMQYHLRNLKIFCIFVTHSANHNTFTEKPRFFKVVEQSTTFSFFYPVLLHHLEAVVEVLPNDIQRWNDTA